ncbi:tetratricopeptide repeat protein [Flavobacterium sp.]|uniref:tetratricopeptide repeat protein n=1 Tax=Flavobacterium sp. TaxID=239 RepID=UPI003BD5C686
MKIKQIIIAGALLVSVTTFAQKDEFKALKKIYNKDVIKGEDLAEYKSLSDKVQPLAVEEGDKVYANFYRCMIPVLEYNAIDKTMAPMQIQMALMKFVSPKSITELAIGLNATLDYEKKTGKKIQTDDINETIASFKPELINYAVRLGNEKKFKESAEVLYSIYQLDKKDQENLYYAANYAVNAHDYDNAIVYYKELKALNYTGEGTIYYAKNKATGAEENFNTKSIRDNMIQLGTHISARDEKIPSKKGEIIRNIALILVDQGKTEEAKSALQEARKENPEDSGLIVSEANIYLSQNDTASYKRLISEAIDKSPNDEILVFNLGVTCGNANQFEDAEKYYRKAIELKPDFTNAYINLADLVLKPDAKIVEELNKLSTSPKDLKRYEVLKIERQKLFSKAMPLLEKAHQLDLKDDVIKSNLKSVYNFLEMTDKVKALKEEN